MHASTDEQHAAKSYADGAEPAPAPRWCCPGGARRTPAERSARSSWTRCLVDAAPAACRAMRGGPDEARL